MAAPGRRAARRAGIPRRFRGAIPAPFTALVSAWNRSENLWSTPDQRVLHVVLLRVPGSVLEALLKHGEVAHVHVTVDVEVVA